MTVPATSGATQRPRKWRRRIAVTVGVLLAPIIALIIYNRTDEAPSALALSMMQPGKPVADEENAWLALVGIGAAKDQAPLDWAHLWVAASNDGVELPAVPLPHQSPDLQRHGMAEHCPRRMIPCLEWASLASHGIDQLTSDNALRLQRYEAILKLRGWRDLLEPSLDSPTPDGFQTALLYLDVQALALVRAIRVDDVDALISTIERVQAHALFWSQVAGQADSMISAMVAVAHIHYAQRLGSEVADRLRPDQLAAIDGTLGALLTLDPTRIDWQGALAGEHRLFAQALGDKVGFWSALSRGEFSEALMGIFYARQATMNLHAQLAQLNAEYLAAPLPRVAAQARLAHFSESLMPPLSDAAQIPGYFSYNAVGKIITAIAVPALKSYGDRVWDYEASRRAAVLKVHAVSRHVEPKDMQAFVDAHPMVDPWTGRQFAWDSLRREIYSEARIEPWRRARLAVPYRDVSPPGTYACPQQWGFALTLDQGKPVFYRSCGDGLAAVRMVSADGPDLESEVDEADLPDVVRLQGEGDRLWVEIWDRNDAGHWRRYGSELCADGVAMALQPLGHEASLDAVVSALPTRNDRWLSVRQPSPVPVALLATEFGGALNIQTRGIEHLAAERILFQIQGPATDLYALLADAGRADIGEPAPSSVAFRARR